MPQGSGILSLSMTGFCEKNVRTEYLQTLPDPETCTGPGHVLAADRPEFVFENV